MSIGSATAIKRFISQSRTQDKETAPRSKPEPSRPSPMQTFSDSQSSFEPQKPKAPTNIKPEPPGATGPAGVPPMTEAQKYEHYKTIIESKGEFDDDPGKRNLLAFRKPTDYNANYGRGQYDDTMVMLWKDKDGTKHVRTYHANTEPNAKTEGAATDVNGDGRNDPARIPEGQYKYKFHKDQSPLVGGEHSGAFRAVGEKPWWGLGFKENSPFDVERDTKHDQSFSEKTGGSNGGWNIEIHAAHEGDAFWAPQAYQDNGRPSQAGGSGVGSAGCVSLPNSEFKQLVKDLGDEKELKFTVVKEGGGNVPLEAPPTPLNIPEAPQWVKDEWEKR